MALQAYARWVSLSDRTRKLTTLVTVLGCWFFGFSGLVVPCVVLYLTAQVTLDPSTLRWFAAIRDSYTDVVAGDHEDLDSAQPVAINSRTAIRFALIAQSRVGILSPSNANRMVYETVLLKVFDEYHVRHNIQLRLLGDALVACFIRPENYTHAIAVIDSMGEGHPPPVK
jgi:hypothetical protein